MIKKIGWHFDNTYSKLPGNLISKLNPTPVKSPKICILNYSLANEIGLDFSEVNDKDIASQLSGNFLPEGSEGIAQAYAGHQFGYFTMLGDGRAILIGEHISKNNKRFDIQFKGSGKTPYSRNGDGRGALGPMLREYIISEAMNNLQVLTTRSLAVIKTGETVLRDVPLQGGILTRVASSHIRVGTFQYAFLSKNQNDLKVLFDYTVNRHYPQIVDSRSPALELLKVVMDRQIQLVTDWMRVGFIHGVMNTDNMTISGETIDYGPCAFINEYNPETVFSSIDLNGRYAFFNQPNITKWNLGRFAESLIPLIDNNSNTAVKAASSVLATFDDKFKKSWFSMMRKKLGLFKEESEDENLIQNLLFWMHKNKADYTNTFCYLMGKKKETNKIFKNVEFINWKKKWQKRLESNGKALQAAYDSMEAANPKVIPRNHKVEEALVAAEANDLKPTIELLKILEKPYKNNFTNIAFQNGPSKEDKEYKTFCGT